jgi:hypothetical protein
MRPPRHVLLLATPLLIAGLAAALLHGQDRGLPLRVWALRLPGTELGMDVVDVDGDGTKDLVISHMTDPQASGPRAVSVFLHAKTGPRFGAAPSRVVNAPTDACAFLAADLDPAPGLEVVFLCPTRVVVVKATGELVETKPDGQLFFDYPEGGALQAWDLCEDLDGDGLPELVIPTKEGYLVLGRQKSGALAPHGDDGGLLSRGKIAVPAETRFGPAFESQLLNRFLTATSRLRRVVVVDIDADGKKDLLAYRNKGLARFLQRKDGTFPERPDLEVPLQLVREAEGDDDDPKAEEKKQKEGSEAFANVRLDLEDVDDDGRVDLVVTRTLGEIGLFESLRTQQLVFKVKKDGTWDEGSPSALVNLKGISADPIFVDFDGDGRRDMILSTYRMDMLTNVKRAILESMAITYRVHLRQDGDDPMFDDEPSLSVDVDVPLSSLEKRGGVAPVDLTADMDGDGVRDMVQVEPDGGLRLTFGRKSKDGEPELDKERTMSVAVERTEPPWVLDLDDDKKSELILEPFGGVSEAARVVRVIGVER